MTEIYIKTRRQALSWDQEYKESVKDIEFYLKSITNATRVENIEIFRLCLGIGFSAKHKRETPPRKTDAVRLSYLKESDMAIFRSVALSEAKDALVLVDEDRIYDIVEQYAAGGLEILTIEMRNQPDFAEWLTQKLYSAAKETSTTSND